VTAVLTIAGYALREALRRRVFAVLLVLTVLFLALFWLGARQAFAHPPDLPPVGLDATEFAGAIVLGLGMFAILFLGSVLAVFLTLGAVRGDAERGLLQPLVTRPVSRTKLLLARLLGAAFVCVPYVAVVNALAIVIVGRSGGWWPDRLVTPVLELSAAVLILAALSLLGSVFLSATANGIAVFMLFGAGLVAGLLGQIAEVVNSHTLSQISKITAWALPFEALYQDALNRITADASGLTEFALDLGPFGGGRPGGSLLPLYALAYLVVVLGVAAWGFNRRDL